MIVLVVFGGEERDGEADVDPDGDDVGADEAGQLPQPDLGGVERVGAVIARRGRWIMGDL